MQILIVGARGMLGSYLSKYLKSKKMDVVEADLPSYNLVSYANMKKLFKDKFDFCINCAAYTNVNQAEIEKQKAYFVNAQGVGVISKLCAENKVHLVHFSTDFIFDGKKDSPYLEEDSPNPLNYYGETKLGGENILLRNMAKYEKNCFTIFRLQWLYDYNPKTFFMKVLDKAKNGEKTLKIVDDEVGSPTSVRHVTEIVYRCITYKRSFNRKFAGEVFHLSHDDWCSRYECAQYFLNKLNYTDVEVVPIRDLDSLVKRPKFGVLDNSKLGKLLKMGLGSWQIDLNVFIRDLNDA